MEQSYTIIIDAKKAHQPSSDEIHAAVRELVDKRVRQFPPGKKEKFGTRTCVIPHHNKQ